MRFLQGSCGSFIFLGLLKMVQVFFYVSYFFWGRPLEMLADSFEDPSIFFCGILLWIDCVCAWFLFGFLFAVGRMKTYFCGPCLKLLSSYLSFFLRSVLTRFSGRISLGCRWFSKGTSAAAGGELLSGFFAGLLPIKSIWKPTLQRNEKDFMMTVTRSIDPIDSIELNGKEELFIKAKVSFLFPLFFFVEIFLKKRTIHKRRWWTYGETSGPRCRRGYCSERYIEPNRFSQIQVEWFFFVYCASFLFQRRRERVERRRGGAGSTICLERRPLSSTVSSRAVKRRSCGVVPRESFAHWPPQLVVMTIR